MTDIPGPSSVTDLQTGFAKLAAALPPALIPQPAQVLSDRQLSCTIQGHFKAVRTLDRSWIVQVPPSGCTVTAVASSTGVVGSALNIPGNQTANIHTSNVTLPLAVQPGDALVLFSGSSGGNPTPAYWQAPTGSAVDEAMAIVFVPYDVGDGMYRPPAMGRRTNPVVYFLRTFAPILHSRADMNKLPRRFALDDVYQIPGVPRAGDADRINPLDWECDRPTWASTVARLGGEVNASGEVTCGGRFAGDVYGEGEVAQRCPWTQHAGYGSNFALANSKAMMMLCTSGEPPKNKEALAHALCQRALDDVARLADGCFLYPDGGHCWGRRGPITLLGHLFNWPDVANIAATLGERLPEDNGFPLGPWWFGGPWTVRFPFSLGQGHAFFADPPATWGDPDDPTHVAPAWGTTYWAQKYPALLGTAVALVLMGCEQYAPKLVQAMRQHQERPPAPAIAQMTAAGFPSATPWRWDRTWGMPGKLAAVLWQRYVLNNPTIPVFN